MYVNCGVTVLGPGKLRGTIILLADDALGMMSGRTGVVGTSMNKTLHAWFLMWCGHDFDVVVAPGVDLSSAYSFVTGSKVHRERAATPAVGKEVGSIVDGSNVLA